MFHGAARISSVEKLNLVSSRRWCNSGPNLLGSDSNKVIRSSPTPSSSFTERRYCTPKASFTTPVTSCFQTLSAASNSNKFVYSTLRCFLICCGVYSAPGASVCRSYLRSKGEEYACSWIPRRDCLPPLLRGRVPPKHSKRLASCRGDELIFAAAASLRVSPLREGESCGDDEVLTRSQTIQLRTMGAVWARLPGWWASRSIAGNRPVLAGVRGNDGRACGDGD